MRVWNSRVNAAVASVIALGASLVHGQTAEPSLADQNRQLAEEVRHLEQRVNDLEARETSPGAVSQTSQQVATDAAQRSEITPLSSLTTGYQPSVGFVIRSPDGAFSLHPMLTVDFRYMTTYRDRTPLSATSEVPKSGSDTQSGFDLTRLRFLLDGTLTKNIGYYIQFQDDQGQGVGLLDAFATYRFDNSPFTLKAGQFKDPVWHERNISEARLMAVDRTYDEALIGGGPGSRVQGVSLLYDQDRTRAQIAVHDGFASLNTKFFDAGGIGTSSGGEAGVTPTNFGFSGRAEYLVIGDRTKDLNPFSEYDQFTALGARQDILVVGGGFDWTQAGSNNLLLHSVDAQYDSTNGLGLYAAYLGSYRDLRSDQGVPAGKYYDPGFVLQASYLVTSKIEPFVRYDYTYLAGGSTTGLNKNSTQEVTVGANYYILRQNAKFTLDLNWLPQGAPTDADALGILKDSGHNEFGVRAQFQIAI